MAPSLTQIDPSRSLVHLASQNKLPTMYPGRQFVEAGGLISYFADPADQGRHVAVYVDKILRGMAPGELPVEHPVVFEMVINLRTAKALGLELAPTLVARADRVIE